MGEAKRSAFSICDHEHPEVCHPADTHCPVCEAMIEHAILRAENANLRYRIKQLEERLMNSRVAARPALETTLAQD